MTENIPIRRRRPRYRGTHPRRFDEKYKELDPERHGAEIQKVIARGHTPAGTHRSICVTEILEILAPRPGDVGLDATLGYGGHALELLKRIAPGGKLFAIDADPIELPRAEGRLRTAGFGEDVLSVGRMNFAGIAHLLTEVPDGFDFILADLGVSSMQIDNPARGFSFKQDGPLDMRFNPDRGAAAADFIRSLSGEKLVEIFLGHADEPHAARVASEIVARLEAIRTTRELADAVRRALPPKTADEEIARSIRRTFQALRIAVNDELNALDRFLASLPGVLKPGGRVAIISFHSGEDRRVKKALLNGFRSGLYERIAPEPIRPSAEERRSNPRSSGAKLRWAVRATKGDGR